MTSVPRTMIALSLLLIACGGGGGEPPHPSPSPRPSTYAQQLLGGLERSAIERTRSDMNAVRTAILAYASAGGELQPAGDYARLAALIAPTYIRVPPPRDAWGNAFVFTSTETGWTLTAPGADGGIGTGDDIVLGEGGFTKLPDGYRP